MKAFDVKSLVFIIVGIGIGAVLWVEGTPVNMPDTVGLHLGSMSMLWLVAMILYIATLVVLFGFEGIQEKVIPHAKELHQITAKWSQDPHSLTMQGAILALSWSLDTVGRLVLIGMLVSAMTTPFG